MTNYYYFGAEDKIKPKEKTAKRINKGNKKGPN